MSQNNPYPTTAKQYGVKVQLTDPINRSAPLLLLEVKCLQQIIGTFLFYGRAIDPTILMALSELSSNQATATEATQRTCHQFLDYCASHPNGSIRYHASDMILKVHRNSSYLNAVRTCSRQGGHFYITNIMDHNILNGTILNLTAIMKMVLSSSAEAEFGALFHNTKDATPLHTTLEELSYPQPPTPTHIDNSTTVGLANDTVTQFLLVMQPHQPKAIPCVLGSCSSQPHRLLHKTPHTIPPPNHAQVLCLHRS